MLVKEAPVWINPWCAEFFSENIKNTIRFSIISQQWDDTGSQNLSSRDKNVFILLLMTWWHKEPRHQQPWYWPGLEYSGFSTTRLMFHSITSRIINKKNINLTWFSYYLNINNQRTWTFRHFEGNFSKKNISSLSLAYAGIFTFKCKHIIPQIFLHIDTLIIELYVSLGAPDVHLTHWTLEDVTAISYLRFSNSTDSLEHFP